MRSAEKQSRLENSSATHTIRENWIKEILILVDLTSEALFKTLNVEDMLKEVGQHAVAAGIPPRGRLAAALRAEVASPSCSHARSPGRSAAATAHAPSRASAAAPPRPKPAVPASGASASRAMR